MNPHKKKHHVEVMMQRQDWYVPLRQLRSHQTKQQMARFGAFQVL